MRLVIIVGWPCVFEIYVGNQLKIVYMNMEINKLVSYLLKCAMWLWRSGPTRLRLLENLYLCNLHKIRYTTFLADLC